jgi:hypothetical protein
MKVFEHFEINSLVNIKEYNVNFVHFVTSVFEILSYYSDVFL